MYCSVFNVLLLCFVSVLGVVAQDIDALFKQHLSPGAQIYYPTDKDWTSNLQQRWSNWSAPTYRAAIKVATVQDVRQVVTIAGNHSIPFLATAAGHGISQGLSSLHNGIDLDISAFNQTFYNSTTSTLTIGGAVKFLQVWNVLQSHGRELPTGAAPCVGAIGATLGAGVGSLQGVHGFMIDALQSVRMVTADGRLVSASATTNPDLFWAIRGAGANFGIVVDATFITYPALFDGDVSEADLAFPASANASIFNILQTFDDKIDPKLSLSVVISYDREIGQATLLVNAVYYGPNATMAGYLKPFLALKPVKTQFVITPWSQLYLHQFFGADTTSCAHNLHLNFAGDGLRKTTPSNWQQFTSDFVKFNQANPLLNASFTAFKYSTEGSLAGPANSTAYPYRDISTYILLETIYPDSPGMDQKVDDFLVQARKTFQPGSGYNNLTLYLNYAHGDEGAEVWYSAAHLPRLAQLKHQWDPHSRFSTYCPVPQHYP